MSRRIWRLLDCLFRNSSRSCAPLSDMYFGRYLGSIVRDILGEMADHHNMLSKATLQSLSQGFPSFHDRIDNEFYNVIQHYNRSFRHDRLQAIYFVSLLVRLNRA